MQIFEGESKFKFVFRLDSSTNLQLVLIQDLTSAVEVQLLNSVSPMSEECEAVRDDLEYNH